MCDLCAVMVQLFHECVCLSSLRCAAGVRCYDAKWWDHFPVGITAVLLYVMGVPVAFVAILFRKRTLLDEDGILLRYGSLYNHLHRKYYFYEVRRGRPGELVFVWR